MAVNTEFCMGIDGDLEDTVTALWPEVVDNGVCLLGMGTSPDSGKCSDKHNPDWSEKEGVPRR